MEQAQAPSRRLKFRVWDVVNKEMIPHERVIKSNVEITTLDGQQFVMPLLSLALLDTGHKLIPMQSTGLYDRSNKEIYDGDLLRVYWEQDIGHFESLLPPPSPRIAIRHATVHWDEKSGMWSDTYLDWFRTCAGPDTGKPVSGGFIQHEWAEVIGNIYENPDLLSELTQVYVPPIPLKKAPEPETDFPDLSPCPQCEEQAWDGRICHACGAKKI